jgi:ribosome-associated translation inhibitor RaiA
LVDGKGAPEGILTTNDLLKSVMVKDVTGGLNLKTRGFEGMGLQTMRQIDTLLGQLSDFVEKREKVKLIELSNKEVKTAKAKINEYELTLQVDFYSGVSLIANENARDMVKGLRLAIDDIKSQARKSLV